MYAISYAEKQGAWVVTVNTHWFNGFIAAGAKLYDVRCGAFVLMMSGSDGTMHTACPASRTIVFCRLDCSRTPHYMQQAGFRLVMDRTRLQDAVTVT